MDMIKSRVHRTLKPLEGFKPTVQLTDSIVRYIEQEAKCRGDIFGIYFNVPDQLADAIVVTRKGIFVISQGEDENFFIDYSEINSTEGPRPIAPPDRLEGAKKGREDTMIKLLLKNGDIRVIHVYRGRIRNRESFEFLRFLMRVIEYLKIGTAEN